MADEQGTTHDRLITGRLVGPVSRNKVRIVFGARQTGKTVLLTTLLQDENSRVFNLQDSTLRRGFEADPASFSRELLALPSSITNIGIDEVQRVPSLLDEVQYLYDREPDRFQFFLTGSSARRLRTQSANLLPGRCHIHNIYPVMRQEEAGYGGRLPIEEAGQANPFPARGLEELLLFGNLPGIRGEAHKTATATLKAYVDVYLEEEIRREALVRDLGSFSNFIRLAALESGNQVNLARLSTESGIDASTLNGFYQLLVDTFVGYRINSYGRPSRKRLLTTPRFLLFDTGVRNAAAGLPLTAAVLTESGGRLLEQWVGQELIHRAGLAGIGHAVTFWRTASGAEIDYIWQAPDEDVPVEVKWTDRPRPGDARHVEAFLDLMPERATRGFVVCRVPRAQQLTERTTAIPWFEL